MRLPAPPCYFCHDVAEDPYRIPKRRVPARLAVTGAAPRAVELFLADRARSHGGPERPSDVLNGPDAFFAVCTGFEEVLLVQREAVCFISVAADLELGEDALDAEDLAAAEAHVAEVEALLEDGTRVEGTVVWLLASGHERLVDLLNASAPFVVVREGETCHLVNKARVRWFRMPRAP